MSAETLGLSHRERQVWGLRALGRTYKEISQELCISEATVRTHHDHLVQKLDLLNAGAIAAKLTRLWLEQGQVMPVEAAKKPPCSCGKSHYARGFCKYHYKKALRKGEIVDRRKRNFKRPEATVVFQKIHLSLSPEDIFRSNSVEVL